MLDLATNPILGESEIKTVDAADLDAPSILARPRRNAKRELLDLRRQQLAAEVLGRLTRTNEIYGFTKGQFSMLDLLRACMERTGPASLVISTWTAAKAEIQQLSALHESGAMKDVRWLIDHSFASRDKQAAHAIRLSFGLESVRVASVHCKFFTLTNARWQLVVRTSMNLNMNPRFEDFTIANDPEAHDFLHTIIDEIWAKQNVSLAERMGRGEFQRHFDLEM